jgi:protein SCO1/2
MKRQLLVLALALAALTAGALFASHLRRVEPPEQARLLQSPRALPDFELTDHLGNRLRPPDLEGAWSWLFFGFTHCPDVCPTTLHTLAGASELLEDLPPQEHPKVMMISVDPMRDDPEQLSKYVPYFNPDFLGATGDMDDLQRLASTVGAAFSYVPTEDGYTVEHTASLFLIDPAGRLSAVFTTPHTAEGLARDFRRVVAARGKES